MKAEKSKEVAKENDGENEEEKHTGDQWEGGNREEKKMLDIIFLYN